MTTPKVNSGVDRFFDLSEKAGRLHQVVDSLMGVVESVSNVVAKFHDVSIPKEIGQARLFKAIALPIKAVSIAQNIQTAADSNEFTSVRVMASLEAVSTAGDIVDDVGTVIGAVDKIWGVAQVVNDVATWLGVVGASIQAIGVPIHSFFIHKGVKLLSSIDNDGVQVTAQKTHIKALSQLSSQKVSDIDGKTGAIDHLKARVRFGMAMRGIAIAMAILTIVAVSLATFGVGPVLIAGVVLSTIIAVAGFAKIGTEIIVGKVFNDQYKAIKAGA